MHSLADLLKVPQDGDEFISAAFLQALSQYATMGNLPPNSFADATGVYQRPAVANSPERVRFRASIAYGDGTGVPAYGVFRGQDNALTVDDHYTVSGVPGNLTLDGVYDPGYTLLLPNVGGFYVNDGPDVAHNAYGEAVTARSIPAWCLYDDSIASFPVRGTIWGTGPQNGKLYLGLPGFRALGFHASSPTRALFIRDDSPVQGRVICDWNQTPLNWPGVTFGSWVAARPVAIGTTVYDGGGGLPLIHLYVALQCPSSQDPAVFTNDIILYSTCPLATSGWPVFSAWSNVGDDKIGTVKMWGGGPADIPPGWREYTNMQGRFPVGIKSGETEWDVMGETGGAKTHTHNFSGSGGTLDVTGGSGSIQSASNVPPFSAVYFIERYK